MNRMLLYAMVIVALCMLSTAWFDHKDFEDIMLRAIGERESQCAAGMRKSVDDALAETKQNSRLLALTPSLQTLLDPAVYPSARELSGREFKLMLDAVPDIFSGRVHISVMSSNGEIVTSSDEADRYRMPAEFKESLLREAMKGKASGGLAPASSGHTSYYIMAEPVRIGEVIGGILIIRANLLHIIKNWAEYLPKNEKSFAAMFDVDGRLIGSSLPNSSEPFNYTEACGRQVFIKDEGIIECADGERVWQAAYSTSRDSGWKIIAASPKEEILSPARRIFKKSMAIHALGAMVSIGILLSLITLMTGGMRRRLASILAETGEAPPKHAGFFEEINIMMNYLHNSLNKLKENIAVAEEERQTLAGHKEELEEEVRLKTKEADNERRLLKEVVRHSPVAIGIVADDIVCLANPSLSELFNLIPGKSVKEAYAAKEQWEANKKAIQNSGYITGVSQRMYNAEGAVREVLFTGMKTEFEGREAIINWHVDITDIRQAEQAMLRAKNDAEKSAMAKKDFLDRMSHEFRTPMNAIIGMCYLCLHTNLDPKQHEYLSKIQSAAGNLLNLINDVLDFSRIEAGKMTLENTAFDITEALNNTYDLLQLKASSKGLAFTIGLDDNVPRNINGDPLRLSQILTNITSNAIKFTDTGRVSITVSVHEQSRSDATLLFTVSDTGIGISPDKLPVLFDSFSQADGYLTRKHEGSGIGLAISKNLVQLMGGKIWVESSPEQGSKFYFTIPFTVNESPVEPQNKNRTAELEKIRDSRILLVEDNETNQMIAQEILEKLGMSVEIVNNGQEALEILERKSFDFVLMDIQMPIMDGLTAAKKIRSSRNPEIAQLPIVAMTAHVQIYDREQSMLAGMNDHLTKPVNPDELASVMISWITPKYKPAGSALEKAPALNERNEQQGEDKGNMFIPGIDTKSGLARVMGNEKLYKNLLLRLATKYDDTALKVQEALNQPDMETAVRLAHTIKGVAAGLGADNLAASASELEQGLKNNGPAQVLLQNFADELKKVVDAINNSIGENEAAPAKPAQSQPTGFTTEELDRIKTFMEILSDLAETDFIAAQNGLNILAPKLESSAAAAEFRALREALEDFELAEISAKASALVKKLTG